MCLERCDGEPNDDCIYEPSEHHPAEYDGDGERDSNGREYNPYSGSITPSEGRCNAVLTNYDERYGERRFCTQLPASQFGGDSEFCHNHRGRATAKRAKDLLGETTVHAKSILHEFDRLRPIKKVLALALYDSLTAQSMYDFEVDVQEIEISFADDRREHPIPPDIEPLLEPSDDGDDDGPWLSIGIPVPNDHAYRCFCLAQAAFDEIKRVKINETIAEDGLLGESIAASGTAESGHIVDTVTEEIEHPLNLAYSRLTKDRKEDLKIGGVLVDDESDVEVTVDGAEDLIMDVDPLPETTTTESTMDLNDALGDERVVDAARDEIETGDAE